MLDGGDNKFSSAIRAFCWTWRVQVVVDDTPRNAAFPFDVILGTSFYSCKLILFLEPTKLGPLFTTIIY